MKGTGRAEARIPVTVRVLAGNLPPLDFPTGLFFSAIPVPRPLLPDDATYWRLTGRLLDRLAQAGRTCLTSGPDYALTWKGGAAVWEGADAVRVIRMARERGPVLAVVNYGGFDRGLRDFTPPPGMAAGPALAEAGRAWLAFEKANGLPPHYVYAYDEPGVEDDFLPIWPRLAALEAAHLRTIGFTSIEDPVHADANHLRLLRETFAPAFNEHTPATLAAVTALGHEPWVYNNGLGRYEQGVHQWRNRKAGMAGRLDWIGAIVQGFQFDALDAREPDPSCFYVHATLGVLVAPRYVGLCEGTLDARLLFELERRAAAGRGAWVPKARALLDSLLARPYRTPMADAELTALRSAVLDLLEAAAKD